MILAILSLVVLFFSIIIHEIAHGNAALYLGDPTAKHLGRLTLNPLKHLDPFGSIILPLILLLLTQGQGPIFGWAKPVPVNPYNFRDQKWGVLKVALAGPATNFLIAVIFGLLIRFFDLPQSLLVFFSIVTIYNFLWGVFNLIPLPPLDGSWILFTFLPARLQGIKIFLQQYGIILLLFFLFYGLSWLGAIVQVLFYLVTGSKM